MEEKLKTVYSVPNSPAIVGVDSEHMIVSKSNPLLSISDTRMPLTSFKIFDAYLGRINPKNPENRRVRFKKGELEKLLGVTRIKKEDLDKRLESLFFSVKLDDKRYPNGINRISLFSQAIAYQDEDGYWYVDLICSEEAMEYIFNIEHLGYLRYRLKNIVNLTSRYSYLLFLYVENNRYRGSWDIPVNELKKILGCDKKTYDQFYRFNGLVLKPSYEEVLGKTALNFKYSSIRVGRVIESVKFDMISGLRFWGEISD